MAIIKRGSGTKTRYQVKVRDRIGSWYPTQTFTAKSQAEQYERKLLVEKDQGRLMLSARQKAMTFREYWELWARECRGATSDGWKITQDQMAKDYILPYLADLRLLEIQPQDIGRTLETARAKGLAPNTLKHVYAILHKVFEDGVEHYGWLHRNPVLRRYRPKIPIREREFLKPQESWRLLNFVRDHYLGPAIWLQILAGLRNSEVQALRWKSVDFERGHILICAAFNNKENRFQEHPKQEDWGRAPLAPALAEFLSPRKGPGEDLVAKSHDGQMLPYETYLRALRRVCDEAGVKRVTPHELRHSCTELYVQAGASAEDIRRLLNQSSLTATARYIHRTDERLQSIAAKVGVAPTPPESTQPAQSTQRGLRLVHSG